MCGAGRVLKVQYLAFIHAVRGTLLVNKQCFFHFHPLVLIFSLAKGITDGILFRRDTNFRAFYPKSVSKPRQTASGREGHSVLTLKPTHSLLP